ncbi:MAG: phosphoenolpyruvate--protein phosphotransferase [Ktedonobacteraceae bacterium]
MTMLRGIPAAPGLAIGPALTLRPAPPVDLTERRVLETSVETGRLLQALEQAIALLEGLQKTTHAPLADILSAQREMLDDPELKQGAIELIAAGFSAEAAISQLATRYAEQLTKLPDAYLAARAEDVREVGRRVVAELRGTSATIVLTQPVILVAHELSPAELAGLDPTFLHAIVAETGSATGHLAIVAQGLDIPAVIGVTDALACIEISTTLIVDGENGVVTIHPDSERLGEAEQRLLSIQRERRQMEIYRDRPGQTADGTLVEVFANIGSLAEARKAVEMGAEGVGLFRTELMAAQGLPSEEAQYAIYSEIASLLHGPLIVRTFDIGGDKPVPGLHFATEANPFLGWRGIRLSLDQPEQVFLPQIRALLRAAATHDIRVMFPMVTALQEVEAARALFDRAQLALTREGYAVRPMRLGIMVETPAAALTLDLFSGLIDFASIGTNDLVQYTYAVDRTNARVRACAQPLGIATLRLIQHVCSSGIPIAVCGQLASDPAAIPLLVGLGVRELSVPPARIPSVKHALAALTLAEMQIRARKVLGIE